MAASDRNELYDEALREFSTGVNTLTIGTVENWKDILYRSVLTAAIVEALLMQACGIGVNMRTKRADFEKLFRRCLNEAEARIAAMDTAGNAPKQ